MKDAILAVDLALLGGNIGGQLGLKHAIVGQTIDYTYTNQFQVGCHNYDCCIACGQTQFNCQNFCNPAWKKRYVQCVPTHQVTSKRELYVNNVQSYCPDCQPAPDNVECKCDGFPATDFTSIGFNSRNSLSTGLGGCGGGFNTQGFQVASKLVTTVTGNKTIQTRKSLVVSQSNAQVPDLYPACILLTLKFQVLGSTTGSCADAGANMTVTYQSVWNGSDTVMQYLVKPMTLQAISWNYDICPNVHPANGDQNVCSGFDMGSFKDADCGFCFASRGYVIDYIEIFYDKYTFDTVCPPLTLNTVIDPVFQPWQTVPPTVQPLL